MNFFLLDTSLDPVLSLGGSQSPGCFQQLNCPDREPLQATRGHEMLHSLSWQIKTPS